MCLLNQLFVVGLTGVLGDLTQASTGSDVIQVQRFPVKVQGS